MKLVLANISDEDQVVLEIGDAKEVVYTGKEIKKIFQQNTREEIVKTEKTVNKKEKKEEKCLIVKIPELINSGFFNEERIKEEEEDIRSWILAAFNTVKENPNRYSKEFSVEDLEEDPEWRFMEIKEIRERIIKEDEDSYQYDGDDVEKLLSIAQRIYDSKNWNLIYEKEVCDLVNSGNGYWKRVGRYSKEIKAISIEPKRYFSSKRLPKNTKMFVVSREKTEEEKARDKAEKERARYEAEKEARKVSS